MAPDTGTAILVLGVFVLPGFVTILLRERLYIVRRDDGAFDRLLLALFYSALVYVLVLAVAVIAGADRGDLIAIYEGRRSLRLSLIVGTCIVLVLPIVIAVAGARWSRSSWRGRALRWLKLSTAHSTRSGWDAMFSQEGTAMIRVRTTTGRIVGGWYGSQSLAAYSDHGGDLFIAERWEFDDDGWFSKPAVGSLGLWVSAGEIATVEVYASTEPSPPTDPSD
ncbi:hypothetical protein GKE82_26340 [Conexibacter sp. W3-3-2]|uniref:DUF6338 family protein n=1 Tax=Conexibacter sp. W3-3-2 TaxID=2675227 RepID=UPI0012B802D1|nr:DUF6338 family protein [Conexibacter sp. W3-3-2]MTD47636.1 hypothetical protein [Conexibacter sp. W3-3-2]MTD47724.1 hypothetical protein [Conexibacter sp. W3-3-2]